MRLATTDRKELIRWIVSRTPDLKVLVPECLRDGINEKLQDSLRIQNEDLMRFEPVWAGAHFDDDGDVQG